MSGIIEGAALTFAIDQAWALLRSKGEKLKESKALYDKLDVTMISLCPLVNFMKQLPAKKINKAAPIVIAWLNRFNQACDEAVNTLITYDGLSRAESSKSNNLAKLKDTVDLIKTFSKQAAIVHLCLQLYKLDDMKDRSYEIWSERFVLVFTLGLLVESKALRKDLTAVVQRCQPVVEFLLQVPPKQRQKVTPVLLQGVNDLDQADKILKSYDDLSLAKRAKSHNIAKLKVAIRIIEGLEKELKNIALRVHIEDNSNYSFKGCKRCLLSAGSRFLGCFVGVHNAKVRDSRGKQSG